MAMEESLDLGSIPSELLGALRIFVKAAALSAEELRDTPIFDPKTPAFRRIVDELLFSAKFVPTYYIVLLTFVGVRSVGFWVPKVLRQRSHPKARPLHKDFSKDVQPLGTTFPSTETPDSRTKSPVNQLNGQHTEITPLLNDEKSYESRNIGFIISIYCRTRAWLNAQPSPIPAITAPLNHLPANGTSLTILFGFAINLFYLFYHVPLSIRMLFAFADRAGRCFAINLPVLYILAAKTNQPLKALTGWSYEGLNIFHRRLGEWMTILAALHGVSMLGVWYTLFRPYHVTLLRFLSNRIILLGVLALVSYLAIYITSTGWVRKLYYEAFLGLHVVLQATALGFLYFHHHRSRPFVLASLAIWSLDRILVRTVLSPARVIATLQVAEDDNTVLLFCDIALSRSLVKTSGGISLGWCSGQHVFVTVPGLGLRHRLQSHPFTIASPAPPEIVQSGKWPLQLTIRAQDGFSRELLAYAKHHQHTEVLLDGPYGSTEALHAVERADRVCFIAGGSGIAVTYPLAWKLCAHIDENEMFINRTIYHEGSKVVPRLSGWHTVPKSDRYTHIWVRQDRRQDSWLTMFPRLAGTTSGSGLDSTNSSGSVIAAKLVNSIFETRSSSGVRPDIRLELKRWVEGRMSANEETLDNLHMHRSTVVVVSGPDSLVREVRNGVASLIRSGYYIEVHVEKFGW